MPPPNKRITFEPSLIFVETPSSLPILDSASDQVQPPDMIAGVAGPTAKNESSSNLNDVTTQPTIIIYPTVPPELELDTVFENGQSQEEESSENPTSSQPPSDEQPEAVIEDIANPVSKNHEKK